MTRVALILLFVASAALALVANIWGLLAALAGSARSMRIAVANDQLLNAAFGGSEDETLSSRAAKAARSGKRWGCVLCRLLDRFDPGHCENNIEPDEGHT